MNLEVAILKVLSASPRALSPQMIAGFVPAFTGSPPTVADITAALRRLETKGHAAGTAHEDHGTLWKDTPEGRLRIA